MKAKDLLEILLQNPDKEVHFVTGDGGCTSKLPVEIIEILNTIIFF